MRNFARYFQNQQKRMKKTLLSIATILLSVCAMAIPAKPGLWRTLTLADGTEIKAQLKGDEHLHFWATEKGDYYIEQANILLPISEEQLQLQYQQSRRSAIKAASRLNSPYKVSIGERTHYSGQKKGLVILVQFTDVKFNANNNLDKYKHILNEKGYNVGKFHGSVCDYFIEQSGGQFELDFDVVGPYTLSNNQRYYGQNDSGGNDMHPDEMVIEACKAADSEVNFVDYDWDRDGAADQVFVLYAGKGEADGGSTNTIWPHMASLEQDFEKSLTLDNIKIDTYACSNEIDPSGNIEGIGCFCHEFSHCMGFPDFYDILYTGQFGMGEFDLMCAGSYNGDGFLPAGYTAHEKMMCGWKEPIVLADEDVTVENLLPMSNNGNTYIIYNDANHDEYFMIENRQKTGFDAGYPAKGLLVTHVDFDKNIWELNIPNTIIDKNTARQYELDITNDHQRMTLMHADNDDDTKYWNSYGGYYTYQTLSTDLYPYKTNDSLTATSKPAPKFFNNTSKGKKTVEWGILDIKQNSNGTMNFRYCAKTGSVDITPPPAGDVLFYESFDQCANKGGNDGLWNGTIASGQFIPDNDGWEALNDKAYGADKCAKFGTSSTAGMVTTPSFSIDETAILTFKAGAWNAANDGTTLKLEADNATVTPSEFTMEKGAWTDFTATITGQGSIRLTFTPQNRLFLDEVRVTKAASPSGIQSVSTTTQQPYQGTYDLQGRHIDENLLKKGIYIKNGRKFIVR